MEKVVEDLGKVISDAKTRLGYSKVVLAGWSGGGSLSLYYQQQAPLLDMPTGGRDHAARRTHQSARHAHRMAGRLDPR